MALEFIKLVKGSSAVAQVGSLGFFKLGVESGGGGGGDFDRVFGNNSWNTIAQVSAEISANNMTSAQVAETYGWNLGDTKSETLTTGEVIQLRIIGYNHDDKSDGSGKAGMTLQMAGMLETKYAMNTKADARGGWEQCSFRKTTLPTIKATFPQSLLGVIKTVDKYSASSSLGNKTKTTDDMFILAQIELTGTEPENNADEGTQYSYWQLNNTDTARLPFANSWLRSTYKEDYQKYKYITYNGGMTGGKATTALGISLALCI